MFANSDSDFRHNDHVLAPCLGMPGTSTYRRYEVAYAGSYAEHPALVPYPTLSALLSALDGPHQAPLATLVLS